MNAKNQLRASRAQALQYVPVFYIFLDSTFSYLQDVVIDAPALVDLGHGTVRYRKPEEKLDHYITNKEGQAADKLKTGYFYHTRLEDYSESK